ncbi:MAG: Crp/Fnr family transcriptional regulator [bacterium]|nr:Crp/Fnr family transcriptional regulator [bacterium]
MNETNSKRRERVFELYPPLKEINQATNGRIERAIVFRRLDAGEYLSTDDHKCINLLFVIQGTLKIEKIEENGKVMKMYELGPGEICHEVLSCYMRCEPLNLTGQAMTDMEVAFLPMSVVDEVLISNPEFMKFMYISLYDKFRKVVLDKEEIIHETIKDRLVKYLKGKNSKTIYITHSEIALDLGTAREVVSRNLKEIEKSGQIKLERNKIKIIDL